MSRAKTEMPEEGFMFMRPGEYDELAPSLDFVPGLLHDSTVALLYGPPGSGKTFLAIHTLCCVALGRSLFGRNVDQRNALYLPLEGEANVKVRIQAWCARNGVAASPIHYALAGKFDLTDEDSVSTLIEEMQRQSIGFLVIDTLALAMVGLDEISGQHVSVVLEALHRIKRETGACVLAVDHTGKNEKAGARGHSSKLGNVDTNIEIVVHNKRVIQEGGRSKVVEDPTTLDTPRSVIVHKQRDGEGGGGVRLHFKLARHETPFLDARGKPMASLAVDEHEHFDVLPDEDAPAAGGLTPLQNEAATILTRLNAKLGRAGPVSEPHFKRELKRQQWGPENAASWRSTYRNLRPKLRIDSDGFVIGIE